MHNPFKKSGVAPALMIGGGLAALGAALFAAKKGTDTVEAVERAVQGTDPPATQAPPAPGTGGVIKARLTGYWPYAATTDAARKMEGGHFDRMMPDGYKDKPNSSQYKAHILHTLEQHLADPVNHPFVSVSGDDKVWPYGQRLSIDAWPNAVFRVVDTGGNFRGAGKVYRIMGYEPLDICVNTSKTVVPKTANVKIVPGDNFAKGAAVATAGIKNQTIAGIPDTSPDTECLARALESELGGRSRGEMIAAAWAIRNRAADAEMPVHQLLTPLGEYGAPFMSGGYASTRRNATALSREVATTVLGTESWADPTEGAVDFWVPEQQAKMRSMGDMHRAAARRGDHVTAQKYARYASYGSEGDVRVQQAADGLGVASVIGAVELLKRVQ